MHSTGGQGRSGPDPVSPAGAKRAMPASSETASKRARTAIPTRTSSGSQSTMLVMTRGPSSRSTRATT